MRNVQCPLCNVTMAAASEKACIAHISACRGFAEKHGAPAREQRRAERARALPRAKDAAMLAQRTASFSNDGTFTEPVPAALLDVLQWVAGTEASLGCEAGRVFGGRGQSGGGVEAEVLDKVPRPWRQDDGTDRHYWCLLMRAHPEYASIYASGGGPGPSLIALPGANASQTAREQCHVEGLAAFHTSRGCSLCGLPAMAKKARCACRQAWFCSRACQKAHWKGHKAECKRIQTALRAEKSNGRARTTTARTATASAAAASAASITGVPPAVVGASKPKTLQIDTHILEEFDSSRDSNLMVLYHHKRDQAFDAFNVQEYNAQMLDYYAKGLSVVEVVPRRIRNNDYFLVCLRHPTNKAVNAICQLAFQCRRQFLGYAMLVKQCCFVCGRPGAAKCECECACFCSASCKQQGSAAHAPLCELVQASSVIVDREVLQLL